MGGWKSTWVLTLMPLCSLESGSQGTCGSLGVYIYIDIHNYGFNLEGFSSSLGVCYGFFVMAYNIPIKGTFFQGDVQGLGRGISQFKFSVSGFPMVGTDFIGVREVSGVRQHSF